MRRIATNRRGMTLVEIMVGLGIMSIVTASTLSLLSMVTSINSDAQLQTLVNQQYFQAVRVTQSPRLFVDRIPGHPNPLGLKVPQLACLNGKGTGCTVHQKMKPEKVPDIIDDTLNANFDQRGRCVAGALGCTVAMSTTWRLICPDDQSCSGIRIDLKAHATSPNPQRGSQVRDREGLVFIPARQFVEKHNVSFHCHDIGNEAIFSIDYLNRTDVCSSFDTKSNCLQPMNIFGTDDNCQANQSKNCPNGFNQLGFYQAQGVCI